MVEKVVTLEFCFFILDLKKKEMKIGRKMYQVPADENDLLNGKNFLIFEAFCRELNRGFSIEDLVS